MCTAPSVTGAAPFESVASPCAKAVSISHAAEPSCVSHGALRCCQANFLHDLNRRGDHEAIVQAF